MKRLPPKADPVPRQPLTRRAAPVLLALLCLLETASAKGVRSGPSLDVAGPGGALQDAQEAVFLAPFAHETQYRLHRIRWDGTLASLQGAARTGSRVAGRGVALMDDAAALAACSQGLLLPVDPSAIPALASGEGALDVDSISPCGIGAFRTSLVLAWDKSRIDSVPTWAMFWDVARRPGKRGLARDPRGTLEIALLADGVPADALYRTLGTDAGLDRAFRKLDQLKPYLVWWHNPAEAVRIIETGAVLMTSAPNGDITVANRAGHRDFGIQWKQSLSTMVDWVLPGRPTPLNVSEGPGPREQAAYALIGFTLDPVRQAQFVARYPAQSLLRHDPAASSALPPDSAEAPDHRQDGIRIDTSFWASHLPAIQARFDSWLDGGPPVSP